MRFFSSPEPPEEEDASVQFRSLPDAEVKKLSAKIRLLARKATVFLMGLRELFDNVNSAPRKIFRDIKIDADSDLLDMRAAAEAVREYLGVSVGAQIAANSEDAMLNMWRQAVEGVGISIFKDSFQENAYSGFCLHDDEFPVIYINNNMAKNRQMFTLFHEMAHILMGTGGVDFRKHVASYQIFDPTEQACNRFAAEVLVPHDYFIKDIKPISAPVAGDVHRLARRYKVSRETIWRMLLTEGRIDRRRYEKEVADIRDANMRLPRKKEGGGNYYLTQLSYLSPTYTDRAVARYHQHRLDAG